MLTTSLCFLLHFVLIPRTDATVSNDPGVLPRDTWLLGALLLEQPSSRAVVLEEGGGLWGEIPTLPFTDCVTLEKVLYLSGPQVTHI